MIWLDKHGYPVEFISGRPIINCIRWVLHASVRRSLRERGRWQRKTGYGLVDTYCQFDRAIPTTSAGAAQGDSHA